MKFVVFLTACFFAVACNNNLSDKRDANITPAPMEEREEEIGNSPDILDENAVPAHEEERARDEESIYQ